MRADLRRWSAPLTGAILADLPRRRNGQGVPRAEPAVYCRPIGLATTIRRWVLLV